MWKAPREGRTSILSILDLRERNYRLAVVNGWLVWLGDAFFNPYIVLAGFAAALGVPGSLVGLLPALLYAGTLLPQAFLVGYVSRLPRKILLYRRMAALRLLGLSLVTLSALFLGPWPGALLGGFFLGLSLNALFNGISNLPFWEVLAKAIPREKRSGLFSARNLIGGFLAFLAGLLTREILALDLPFPLPYALVFALGTLAFGIGWYLFGLIDEPEDPPSSQRPDLLAPLKDPGFRRYLGVRAFLALGGMAEPFFAAYAVQKLGQKEELGLYLAFYALSFTLCNLLWAQLAQKSSKRVLLPGMALALLALLLAPLLPPGTFGVVFFLQGAYLSAFGLATSTYLLNLAPEEKRSAYIGLGNTLAGVMGFAPVLGGVVLDRLGFSALFLLAALAYALGLLLGRRLPQEG
ncbi:MFS transporter [Thermus composti]|uniref:MFS transporter n=1 Tax=Thermus composti TaxID=532059 RepID=A0ABV6Q2F8_9DEIN|nr:MFS transporter [Thermus composti]GGM98789.1 MFS transporter [Thermus composti]